MIGSPAIAHVVADLLDGMAVPIVFDPVMIASSGSILADDATRAAFERLMLLAVVTTPNVAELAALGGDAMMAKRDIAYLAKGGDAPGDVVLDRLLRPHHEPVAWSAPRIVTRHNHGTGCTLSSAIATALGRGDGLVEAIQQARSFVRSALDAAPDFGAGHGPMGHHAVRGEI